MKVLGAEFHRSFPGDVTVIDLQIDCGIGGFDCELWVRVDVHSGKVTDVFLEGTELFTNSEIPMAFKRALGIETSVTPLIRIAGEWVVKLLDREAEESGIDHNRAKNLAFEKRVREEVESA